MPRKVCDGPEVREADYISALRFRRLSSLCDPILRWMMRKRILKEQLIEPIHAAEGHRILDLGYGTGTLTLMLTRAYPDGEVIGIEAGAGILEIGRKKVRQAG